MSCVKVDMVSTGRVGLKVISRQVRHQQRRTDKRNRVREGVGEVWCSGGRCGDVVMCNNVLLLFVYS